jgi:hypothetical protein
MNGENAHEKASSTHLTNVFLQKRPDKIGAHIQVKYNLY